MEHLETIAGPTVTQSGTLTSGQATVTGLTTSALAGAVAVTGAGVPPGTYVLSIDSATQITLTQNATASGAQDLTFSLEPITLAEAKLHCRIDADLTADDSLIAGLITSARLLAEAMTHETFLTSTYDWFMDQFPTSYNGYLNRLVRSMGPNPQWLPNGAAILRLPKPPVVSVASVMYYDPNGNQQTVDPSTYFVSTGMGARVQPVVGRVWPVVRPQIDAVVIHYTAGLANAALIPENRKSAIKLLVGHLYENREASVSASIGSRALPMGVESLLGIDDGWSYA